MSKHTPGAMKAARAMMDELLLNSKMGVIPAVAEIIDSDSGLRAYHDAVEAMIVHRDEDAPETVCVPKDVWDAILAAHARAKGEGR